MGKAVFRCRGKEQVTRGHAAADKGLTWQAQRTRTAHMSSFLSRAGAALARYVMRAGFARLSGPGRSVAALAAFGSDEAIAAQHQQPR